MKKLTVAFAAIGMTMLMSISAFADTTTFNCPNNNAACISSSACINDGQCQYQEGCQNNSSPKRDGTGNQTGGQRRGHCGRN